MGHRGNHALNTVHHVPFWCEFYRVVVRAVDVPMTCPCSELLSKVAFYMLYAVADVRWWNVVEQREKNCRQVTVKHTSTCMPAVLGTATQLSLVCYYYRQVIILHSPAFLVIFVGIFAVCVWHVVLRPGFCACTDGCRIAELFAPRFCKLPCGGIGVDMDTVWCEDDTVLAARMVCVAWHSLGEAVAERWFWGNSAS